MYTSGIGSVRPDFYSGRGVKKCDLDYLQLVEIFLKLIVLDKKYAIAFANMVLSIKTLGATEFMESFYNLGRNNFVFEQETISNKNNSLNSTPQERLSSQAVAVVANVLGNKQEESVDISLTESMKRSFIEEIKELLDTIDPNFDYGDYSPSGYESFGWGKPHMRLR